MNTGQKIGNGFRYNDAQIISAKIQLLE